MIKKLLFSLLTLATLLAPMLTYAFIPPDHCLPPNGTVTIVNNCWAPGLSMSLQVITPVANKPYCCGADNPQMISSHGGQATFSIVNNCPYNITGAGSIPNYTLTNGQVLTITGNFPHPCVVNPPK